MTTEQAIKWLNALKSQQIISGTKEALDMAIEALKCAFEATKSEEDIIKSYGDGYQEGYIHGYDKGYDDAISVKELLKKRREENDKVD